MEFPLFPVSESFADAGSEKSLLSILRQFNVILKNCCRVSGRASENEKKRKESDPVGLKKIQFHL
jgi:hypothetical protein